MKYYLLLAAAVIIFFIVQSVISNKRAKELLRSKIKTQWGNPPDREYTYQEFEKITHYYKKMREENPSTGNIDDITWNDLDMDNVFLQLNTTWSSIGEDFLYYLLRTPVKSLEELKERDRMIEYFSTHEEESLKLQEIFANIGRTKSISLHDYIYGLKDLGKRSNTKHYIRILLLLASLTGLFFVPQFAIAATIIMIAANIIAYTQIKAEIESYFVCFRYLITMIVHAEEVIKLNIKELDSYNKALADTCKSLSSLKRGISFLTGNKMSGSIGDIIMDYIRMLFHVDIIKFNSMLAKVIKQTDKIDEIFITLGKMESMTAIASYRKAIPYYCKPEFQKTSGVHLQFKEIYHPLIESPVVNDLNEIRGILLTGSNASGKSTFLKTVAINAVLAQTIYTCLAREYHAEFYSIYSSMALKDDLGSNESYYIVEIKSLKRILDKIRTEDKILCFIDEVLRGTNTVERIAASSQILKSLALKKVMCFAATHDIELTHMLESHYANYHFQEEVLENDIKFNYHLYKGRATSRNAIKLLSIIGYEEHIVKEAESAANHFVKEGVWGTP